MKKTIALLFLLFLVCSILPATAFAAGSFTITSGGTYYLDDYGDDSTIDIETTEAVVLSQRDAEKTFYNVVINCMACDTRLTINGLQIQNDNLAPLSIIDYSCELTLSGESDLSNVEGNYPALRVSSSAELTTQGNGRLIARGGEKSAGIGGAKSEKNGKITIGGDVYIKAYGGRQGTGIGSGSGVSSGGIITILSGTVIAQGGYSSAGIGGSSPAGIDPDTGGVIRIEGGNVKATGGYWGPGIGGYGVHVSITGGTVEARGTDSGAGIGNSFPYKSGSVSISGGTVLAYGSELKIASSHYSGAGIGGGNCSVCDSIYISGGTVTAYGGNGAAGIGSGNDCSQSCKIFISGGTVFASGNDACDDIGDGEDNTDESALSLYGDDTKVFLENDKVCDIATSFVHFPLIYVDSNNRAYGYDVPYAWNTASLYVSRIYNVTYNANGAKGTPPEAQEVIPAGYVTIPDKGSLLYEGKYFTGWNTNPNGAKEMYYSGNLCQINGSVELFAIWSEGTASISLSDDSITVNKGGSAAVTATTAFPNPDNNVVYWMTSDPAVASVSQSGRVYGVSPGKATITAYFGGKSASCAVRVRQESVDSVSLNHNSKTMNVGEMFALKAEISPEAASGTTVVWDSSDYTVAMVNSDGIVTAEGAGTCTITAEADGETDTCEITVSRDSVEVESVSLSMGSEAVIVMYEGDTMVLSANVSPSNADDKLVTWQSSNTAIAGVTSFGKVTAVAAGEAVITVTVSDKTDSYKVLVKASEGAGGENEQSPELVDAGHIPEPTVAVDLVYNIQIDTTSLPYGAQYIKLPNGEIIELNGEETISCEISGRDIRGGALKIVALDSEQKALGDVEVSAEEEGLGIIMIVLIALGTLLIGAGGTLFAVKAAAGRKRG